MTNRVRGLLVCQTKGLEGTATDKACNNHETKQCVELRKSV